MNNVIPLNKMTSGRYEIVVLKSEPSKLMMQAVQALQENKAVILKLEHLEKQQAQRVLDFVSGSAYAITSHPSKVGSNVFLFVPYSIQIQSELSS